MTEQKNINITTHNLLGQFDFYPYQEQRVKRELATGINWLRRKGHIDIVLDEASKLPKDGQTNIFKQYFPAIAITYQGMNLILKNNGVVQGWDGNPKIVPAELIIARTFKLIGDKMPTFNRDVLTMFVPREIPSCVRAMEIIEGQFNGRVNFVQH